MNNNKIDSNYTVTKNFDFSGMITGIVTVKSGVGFINRGMLCEDVIIEQDAYFGNYGTVIGSIKGDGHFELWGKINGDVSPTLDAQIHMGSYINGKRIEKESP